MLPISVPLLTVPSAAVIDDNTGGHRYWRLYHPFVSPVTQIGWGEIELIGPSNTDLTSPGAAATKATASSVYVSGCEAAEAFDDVLTVGTAGNYNYWQAASNTAGTWIKWDFGAGVIKNIIKVRCYANPDGSTRSPTCVHVQYSDDDSTWTTAWVFVAVWPSIGWKDFDKTTWNASAYNMDHVTGTTGLSGYTTRCYIPAEHIKGLGSVSSFRLGFKAYGGALTIDKVRVGLRDTAVTGNVVAFKSSPAPVYATFGGSASSGSKANGTRFETDDISFAFNNQELLVAIYMSSSGSLGWSEPCQGSLTCDRGGGDDTANNAPSGGYTYPRGTSRTIIDKIVRVT